MVAYRNIRYRLIAGSPGKAIALNQIAGSCRWVWNLALAETQKEYQVYLETARLCEDTLFGLLIDGPEKPCLRFTASSSVLSLGKRFTKLRKETPWLQELPYAPVRYALKYQADAWQRFFAGLSGRPKFKAHKGRASFTLPQDVKIRTDSVTGVSRISIPKAGWYILRGGNPYPEAKPKRAVITRGEGNKWYCVVCYEVEPEEKAGNGRSVGIDRNCGQVATSDGVMYLMPDVSSLEGKARRHQRLGARGQKGSRRSERHFAQSRKAEAKIARIRCNAHHKISADIAQQYGTVVVENLNIKGMTASAKGTVENPGKNVSAKSGLNRALLATGLSALKLKLDYKAHRVMEVNPAWTSQTCSTCGHVAKESRKSQSYFRCVKCGFHGNADANAALNVFARGTGAYGRRGAWALAPPKTRQQDILRLHADHLTAL